MCPHVVPPAVCVCVWGDVHASCVHACAISDCYLCLQLPSSFKKWLIFTVCGCELNNEFMCTTLCSAFGEWDRILDTLRTVSHHVGSVNHIQVFKREVSAYKL